MRILKSTLFILAISLSSQAQVKQLWKQQINEGVRWQKVTSLGHYVIGTSKGIMGINPDTGQTIWSTSEFGPVAVNQVEQVGSSPLLSINLNGIVYMISPYNGATKFNSKKAGIAEVNDQFVLFQSDGILVSGRNAEKKDVLLMSSLSTGEVVWSIQEDFGRVVTANEISADELLIVTLFYNYKVNPKTGKVIWKNDVSEANSQMEKMGALGGLMKQMASNVAQDMELNVEFYQHPKQPVFYVASEQEGKAETTGFSSTTTSGGPSYHTVYSAFNINDGSRIWDKPLDINGEMGPIYFHEQGLVILPNNGLNTKVNLYDYKTQEGMWGKKGNGIKVKGGIYSYSHIDNGLIFVSQNNSGKNFITYFDLATTNLTFSKPVTVDGEVIFSEHTPKGLLYVTSEEANILNTADGSLLYKNSIRTNPSLIAHQENTLYAYDGRASRLVAIDKSSGIYTPLGGEIKFEGKEVPENIQIRPNGVLITSSQNLALVGFDGKIVYQKYFEAPREPGLIRALAYANAVRAAYIGAVSYTASAAFQSASEEVNTKDPVAGVVYQGVGEAYEQLGDAAIDFAKQSFTQANARFKATQDGDNYTVLLTTQEKGNVLMKVNKDSGESEGVINLGKDKAPDYEMDGVTGVVFYNTGSNTITAYKF